MLKNMIFEIIGLEEKKYLLEQAKLKLNAKINELEQEKRVLINTKVNFNMSKPTYKKPDIEKPNIGIYIKIHIVLNAILFLLFHKLLTVFIILSILLLFFSIYCYNLEKEDCRKALEKSKLAYTKKCAEYKKEREKHYRTVALNNLKIENLNNNIKNCEFLLQTAKKQQTEIEVHLFHLYFQAKIHLKYQNIVAMTTIYDYLSTGICSKLEGPDGAYKFYEEQAMRHFIATSLSEAMKNITAHQKTLEAKISSMNREMDSMQIELKDTDKNYQRLSSRIEKLKAPKSK